MPPKLLGDGGAHVVIRPLLYCAEEDIRAFSEAMAFPILPCDLCGSQENLQRKRVGRMIDELEAGRPGTKAVMLAALQNVRPSQLLDRRLWSTLGVHAAHEDEEAGESGPQEVVAEQRLVRG
jgi:tRNA 2-thiocytidine biosynthesis protein TtcA